MADYTVVPQRFLYGGIVAVPPDIVPPGKYPYALNVRAYEDGSLSPRAGLSAVVTPGLGSLVHTLARLNDPTTFNGGVPAVRVIGSGANLYRGSPSDLTPPLLDSGYSGNPLTMVSAQPPQSPRPYLYVADSQQFRKFTTDGNALAVGLAQPIEEPSVAIDQQQRIPFDPFISGTWTAAGTSASAPVDFLRVSTVISQIVYDDAVNNVGYASIVPANLANITTGILFTVGDPLGSNENSLVTDVTIPIVSTTVAAIIYDSGNTGLCTIQPAGSLGTGQLDAPPIQAYRERAFKEQGIPYTVPAGQIDVFAPSTETERRVRQVDFPVDCLVVLNGVETVRILSVAIGPDGTQSFRCSTATTISAGDTMTGLASFRIYLNSTWTAGAQLTRHGKTNTLSYGTPPTDEPARLTGGIQSNLAENMATFIGGRMVLPEDELHLAIKIDRLNEVRTVRVYLDVDAATNDFLENYYFHEWRASDIINAIQATNAASVTPLIDARKTVLTNLQLDLAQNFQRYGAIGGLRNLNLIKGIRKNGIGTYDYNLISKQPGGDSAISTQLGLGNDQWVDLRVKIGTLTRVGTDPTRSLADVHGLEILVSAEGPEPNVVPNPLNVQYTDLQIYGGGGPDVGDVGDPYVYAYRYRSSETGAVSNPSPASRGGVIPRRQNVLVTPTASADPQVDRIDWFRLGGALTAYTYVGTGPNTSTVFQDDREDSKIDGGELIDYGNFQPWPLQDLPRTGTCNVAGTAVEYVSGDAFNASWAPGSIILVNGRATTLYASPVGNILQVVDALGSATGAEFSLPGATLLSQPLGRCWGPYQGFYFACGDQTNPGTLYWSRGNNIEAADDKNALVVTTPSEPLQNGFVYNTFPGIFTSEDLYAIISGVTDPGSFRAIKTPCGRGLWTPWAFDLAPEGIYFLAADGIYLTVGGSPAESKTSPDLRAIFPHDGIPGISVNGIPAPDMTQTTRLRLSYIAGYLYFDYLDLNGNPQTLEFDTRTGAWSLDHSDLTGLTVRLEEPGAGVYDQIVGGADGRVYQYDNGILTDAGTALPYALSTRWVDADVPRLVKQWGDIGLDVNPGGSLGGIAVVPVLEDGSITTPGATVGVGVNGRDTVIVPLPVGGILARNLGIQMTGSVTAGDSARPQLFWWEPTFIPKAEDINIRPTDWDNLGYQGAKFIQGIVIRANTYGLTQTLQIQRDGGATALTIDINHNGEQTKAYPLAAAGWLPFVSELVRIVPTNLAIPWQLLDLRWVWEPAPELATQWETQFTSQDWPGYGTVTDMVFAYEATAPFVLTFTFDDRQQVYMIPANGGNYSRYYFRFCPNKAKAVKYQWKTTEPGRIYQHDVATRIQGWGQSGGYRIVNPFGGPSRERGGAQI